MASLWAQWSRLPVNVPGVGRAIVLLTLCGAFLLLASPPVLAIDPNERLADPRLEERARGLSAELRCLVCQNQSIDDSDAPLAGDLRRLVRERLLTGESDAQVKDHIVARYGDFVLLKPPFNLHTLLLWFTPLLVLLAAAAGLWRTFQRRALEPSGGADGQGLSLDEERRLKDLLGSDHQVKGGN